MSDAYQDRARAESFGAIARQYDRARPAYPGALVDALATLGGVHTLDVGCGTGKAAVLLAARGLRVLGVEIDPAMALVARGRGLDVEVSSFEDWDDRGRRFDLLTSAQAWHWVDPAVGARKAGQVVRSDGAVALFWNVESVAAQLRADFDAVYARYAPELVGRMDGHAARGAGSVERAEPGLVAAGFVDIAHRRFDWQQRYSREQWLDLLGTFSDHHLLGAARLAPLLAGLGEVVDAFGGAVTVEYSTLLLLARH